MLDEILVNPIWTVTVTSHDLIFVTLFCTIAVFPCEWKPRGEMMQIYNYCLSEDLKYMNINQENKIYWLRYYWREHKLFIQYNVLKNEGSGDHGSHSKTHIYADQRH